MKKQTQRGVSIVFGIKKRNKNEKRNESIDYPGKRFKQTKPIKLHQKPVSPVRDSLDDFLLRTIYKPLFDSITKSLGQKQKFNSKSAVINAIRTNQITYVGDEFTGKFNAPISKGLRDMGAVFNKHTKTFKISSASIPTDVKSVMATAKLDLEKTQNLFNKDLTEINNNIDTEIEKLIINDNELFDDLAQQYEKSVKSIGVQPNLSDTTLDTLKTEYRDNLKLYIKDWTKEAINRLRGKVQEDVLGRGLRAEDIVDTIKSEYGVSQKKAEFLARQESSLVMSKYREESFEQVGVVRYKWSTANDSRVRPDHRALDGKVFTWRNPPVVDRSTGRHGNPGEDFGCRCVAIPIVED